MGNMRLKYRIPLAIIAILMVITLFMGSSYALWKTTDYQETVNKIATGCFELSFTEDKKSINLDNTYPMEDEKGAETIPYRFTITNTCTTDAEYTIYLNTLKPDLGTKIADDLIKVALLEENGATMVAHNLDSLEQNVELSHFAYPKELLNSYIIGTGKLKGKDDNGNAGESVTYDLRIWIDEKATTAINGQTFEAAVASVAYATSIH